MSFYEMFLRFPDFKTKTVTLSFDDGFIEDRKMIEILNKNGIKCTFNLNSGIIKGFDNKVQFEELKELYKGHEVACHTYTHPHLNNLDLGEIAFQVIKDREILEEQMGCIVEGFAYPFGLIETEGMIECIKNCGIKYGRTTASSYKFDLPDDYLRWNPTCWQTDSKIFELAEEFFKPDDTENFWRIKPMVFYIGGHSYEFRGNWERLEKICKTFGNKENIWYATNMEIIEYISAFKSLCRSVNGEIIHNPTNINIFVVVNGKNLLIEKGKTIALK